MAKFKWDVVKELHAPARRNFPRRRVDIRDIDETWQADLVDMSVYAKENSGNKFLLTVIDIFSKFAWAVPIKTKNGRDVSAAMESILKLGRVPKKLHVDNGKEFYNSQFQALLKKNNIQMYSTFTHLKASICERFNRTIKRKMWLQFSHQGNYKWIEILPKLIHEYNNNKHRTIRMKPAEVTEKNAKILKSLYAELNIQNRKKSKFTLKDPVRISKYKHVFEKGYIPSWTNEIFTIEKVHHTFPTTYQLKDYSGNPIQGRFYEEELSKVKHPNIYLVEKVLKKRGKKIFVKWLGFSNEHNEWIDSNAL